MTDEKKPKVFAEDRMAHAIDRCFSDAVIKSGVGFALGGVFSLLFFRRRAWPLIGGTFFGLGTAYNNCEKSLNNN